MWFPLDKHLNTQERHTKMDSRRAPTQMYCAGTHLGDLSKSQEDNLNSNKIVQSTFRKASIKLTNSESNSPT